MGWMEGKRQETRKDTTGGERRDREDEYVQPKCSIHAFTWERLDRGVPFLLTGLDAVIIVREEFAAADRLPRLESTHK